MKTRTLVFSTLVCLSIASITTAAPLSWTFPLDGLQETPPVATPGTGDCQLDFDDVTGDWNLLCNFSGLIGTANNAHIHGPALPGVPAGVLVGLSFTPASSGTITGSGTFAPTVLQHVLDGLTYVNLHSTFRPAGEIRGQIVPEPTTALLLGLGALGIVARRSRRK